MLDVNIDKYKIIATFIIVKLCLGVTNNSWFNYLQQIQPEDVNFWQPGGNVRFKSLNQREPFLFKLKSPENAIGGVGFFSSHTFLPMSVAWEVFGNRNGCETYEEFSRLILGNRADKNNSNPQIGCIVLNNPVFFERKDWIETPPDWSKSVQQWKGYVTETEIGNDIWQKVEQTVKRYWEDKEQQPKEEFEFDEPGVPLYRSVLSNVRIGQGAFKVKVIDAYQRRCSISGEKTLPVLEGAHIKPYSKSGPHSTSNGILLRSDIHTLFDAGYLTITTDFKIEVSKRIREEFANGKEYYQYHGKDLIVTPQNAFDRPHSQYIDWHNANVFRG